MELPVFYLIDDWILAYSCGVSRDNLFLSDSLRCILRIRIDLGVISTSSSSLMYSNASSSENLTAGAICILSSLPAARTLVCFFDWLTFAYHLSFIHIGLRFDEKTSAILQSVNSVCKRFAGFTSNE